MKVCTVGLNNYGYSKNLMKDFLNFLQSELPLDQDLRLVFVSTREGNMTTGVREPNEMRVLSKGRMLIDVLRTLSHEWVHEFQHQKLGVPEGSKIPDIGGPIENMASVLSSIFLKKFQKKFPEYSDELYNNE
jgi:hypothetical protein